MRLGGPLWQAYDDPESWITAVKNLHYTAAYCPVPPEADSKMIQAFRSAADKADIVIAEVGAWSNPLSPSEMIRRDALDICKKSLALADEIDARCCVNIAGSRGMKWDGPHKDDLTQKSFEMIVETVQDIIDSVKPTRSFYTLETMPWMFPDSPDSYLQLLDAIDRKAFAVHLDPVNLINSPSKYFRNGELITECIKKLGPHIRSCHVKDITLGQEPTVHLTETRPGLGGFDYTTLLYRLNALNADVPLMLEHLSTEEDSWLAAEHIRSAARLEGISL
ncbi:xylose isomerase [candidate division KSB3 bacterium]|uniref:Xylose isomerase n=1 Tax=candidate division KSB3 bacterium TaxID=2044937 RepID=A0A2G6E3T6_9BACT|nr:MAG: xylose isomerase [candidate division KSB3 bacterium]PIE29111.1 MAG: xylose isomerase [candidate division KSB3 bacterium]